MKGVLKLKTLFLIGDYEHTNQKSNDVFLDMLKKIQDTNCRVMISTSLDKEKELERRLKEEKFPCDVYEMDKLQLLEDSQEDSSKLLDRQMSVDSRGQTCFV